MSEAERQLLVDMREHARLARRLVHGMEFETFRSDLRTRYAAQYLLLVVGEAASRLPPAARAGLAEIPWPRVIGMRHVLAHDYARVDPRVVYRTVVDDLRDLLRVVSARLAPNR
jgi:uncharacterized protein with HEPN domain